MKLDWQDGAPEKLETGMIVKWGDSKVFVVGDIDNEVSVKSGMTRDLSDNCISLIKRWAWLIKPYQLEWLQDMAKRDKKS